MHVKQRLNRHFSELRGNKHHNFLLQEDFNKYGENSFSVDICDKFDNENDAREKEQEYIDNNYDSIYNISKFSKGCGDLVSYHPRRDEIAELQHKLVKRRFDNMTDKEYQMWCEKFKGDSNPMYGKHHTEEAKRKMSQARLGVPNKHKGEKLEEIVGEEEAKRLKAQMSARGKKLIGEKNPFYGKHHSDKTKKLISKKNMGKRNPRCWKKVLANGRVYGCISDAAKDIGVCPGTIIHRAKSKYFENYRYL